MEVGRFLKMNHLQSSFSFNRWGRGFSIDEIASLVGRAVALGLEGVEVLGRFSLEEIQKEFNGIGPDRMGRFHRGLLTWLGQRYLPAVVIHDMDYVVGGGEQEFHESNMRLGRNLDRIRRGLFWRWSPARLVEKWAIILIVKICERTGWAGFHKSSGMD